MGRGQFLSSCATLACFYFLAETAFAQNRHVQIPRTKFKCTGRASGYYADVDTGCQVYHMCDGLGRQFSYTCPNTTLFQQRMLVCDHWYMVNCSMSERDYDANLLIGQRDKPFVSEEEMHFRTPRPDILSVPLNSNYYDGLKEAESKFPVHPGNSIVGIADSISSANNNGLDSGKNNYRPPTSWSTGTNVNRPAPGSNNEDQDSLTGAASLRPNPTFRPSPTFQPSTGDSFAPTEPSFIPSESFQPSPENAFTPTQNRPTVTAPAQDLVPPLQPSTTEASSEEFSLDVRMKEDPVFQFIKRFDPNSPDSHKTAMTKNEILNLNQQLPDGQSSAEEERTPRRNKNVGNNNFNFLQTEKKGNVESSRFDTVNLKPTPTEATLASDSAFVMPTPSRELLPPKSNYSEQPSTTMGPPVYYEWKWAAPAFDLEPPKESNVTANSTQEKRNITGRSPFRDVRRPTPADIEPTPPSQNTEYNISSYFVPDYLFPLEKGHPGYEDENAETSFQVKVSRPGRASFGENLNCPHCHPAYLNPGTCEPCIVRR